MALPRRARQVVSSQLDDPTWLTYTVYGDPGADGSPVGRQAGLSVTRSRCEHAPPSILNMAEIKETTAR